MSFVLDIDVQKVCGFGFWFFESASFWTERCSNVTYRRDDVLMDINANSGLRINTTIGMEFEFWWNSSNKGMLQELW